MEKNGELEDAKKNRTAEDVRRALELDAKRRKNRTDKRIAFNPEEYKDWIDRDKETSNGK